MSTLYLATAVMVIGYVAAAFALDFTRRRGWLEPKSETLLTLTRPSERIKWWAMLLSGLGSVFVLLYCNTCEFSGLGGAARESSYPYFVYRDLLSVLPWFVLGCILAGFILKLMTVGNLRLPRTMLGSSAFAALVPICSCAAVPMAHSMMLGRRQRLRAVIAFLVVVPVLSPVVFLLAVSQIGILYLTVEIVAVFALAMVTGIVAERLVGVREPGNGNAPAFVCKGCRNSHAKQDENSALVGAWDQLWYLMKYILLGILIGAAIGFQLERDGIALISDSDLSFLGGPAGLMLMVLVAIPLFICSGEEVIILAPLLASGLPLGHAIAFAIAGNAICITAVPVLNATFGNRVTALLFTAFFVGALAIGLLVNMTGLSL